jgi:hypothetical protein
MDELAQKPWLRWRISCEFCERSVNAPLVITADGDHTLDLYPLKVVHASRGTDLLHWAILCTACVPAYIEHLKAQHPDRIVHVTDIQARDAEALQALLDAQEGSR